MSYNEEGRVLNKRMEALRLLEKCRRRFRTPMTQKYIEEVANLISKRLTIKEMEIYLDQLAFQYETFPYLKNIETDIRAIEKGVFRRKEDPAKPLTQYVPPEPKPLRVPGTPPTLEALFLLIEKGRTEGAGFRVARSCSWAKDLSDEALWACYEAWIRKEIHPIIQEKIKAKENS